MLVKDLSGSTTHSTSTEHFAHWFPSVASDIDLKDAADEGDIAALEKLYAQGGLDVNKISEEGQRSALHYAALHNGGDLAVIDKLIEFKADVNMKYGASENSVLHWCAKKGHYTALRHLVSQHCAEVNAQDNTQMAPLHQVCEEAGSLPLTVSQDSVRCLVEHNGDLSAKDRRPPPHP